MRSNLYQWGLLLIAIGAPFLLLMMNRRRWLLGWVCVTFSVQFFDTSILTNLPAGRIVGLLYLPTAMVSLREWIGLKPVKAWLINYAYLLLLGLLFGWLWPWPDITLMRPFNLLAQGRSLIYLVRLLSDVSLALFIAAQLREPGSVFFAARAIVLGATISSVAGFFSLATGIDLAYAGNDFEGQPLTANRLHGVSGEPRGLGLVCAYALMILLVGQKKLYRFWPLLVVINLLALLGTSSTSAFALLLSGLLAGWVFFSNRTRWGILWLSGATAFLILVISVYFPTWTEGALNTVVSRVDPGVKLAGIRPGTLGQEIAYRLDVFDASALLFLLAEPLYALIGAGPGLVSLPASFYVPPGLYSQIWSPQVGINSLPFHGLLLELSNSGVLGVALWFVQVFSCWAALRWLASGKARLGRNGEWWLAWAIFVIGVVFYTVQVSVPPMWSLILGIGWCSYRTAAEGHPQPVPQARWAHNLGQPVFSPAASVAKDAENGGSCA